MRKTFKSALVLGLAAVFTVGSVLCCCVRNIAQAHAAAKIHSCCAAKAKADTQHKAGDCSQCSSSLKIAEAAQPISFVSPLVFAFKVLPADMAFIPRPQLAEYKTAWINGPPGFFTAVPLYIQSRSIRI